MYTLIYHNEQFNRPDTLLPFLQANVVKSPQIQIDYRMPYYGTAGQLMNEVCAYLSNLDSQIEVWPYIESLYRKNCSGAEWQSLYSR